MPFTDPLAFVIFGASGDLAKKKLYPACWWHYRVKRVPQSTHFIGYSRSDLEKDNIKEKIMPHCKLRPEDEEMFDQFVEHLSFIQGSYDEVEGFKKLNLLINELYDKDTPANRIFYLALPSRKFEPITKFVKQVCMATLPAWTRIVVEKPFGRDSETYADLSKHLATTFAEDQIYRCDHYLGKEMVQNLMVLRFGNNVLSRVWDRDTIANVTIASKESSGTEGRGGYFDEYGIIRDVMQNHLVQILSLVAMEEPASVSPDDVWDAKVEVLKHIAPLELRDVVLGQYVGDPNAKGTAAGVGYLDDPTVPESSITPTYALALAWIKNKRWDGVPFFLKCGKALNEQKTEVRIQFKDVDGDIFPEGHVKRKELIIRVQPEPAVYMKVMIKSPDAASEMTETELDMMYNERYTDIPDAYERLILDVLSGTQKNFVRSDEPEQAWRIFTPLLHKIESEKIKPETYVRGTRGPASADEMMKKHGFVFTGTYTAVVTEAVREESADESLREETDESGGQTVESDVTPRKGADESGSGVVQSSGSQVRGKRSVAGSQFKRQKKSKSRTRGGQYSRQESTEASYKQSGVVETASGQAEEVTEESDEGKGNVTVEVKVRVDVDGEDEEEGGSSA